MSNSSEYFNLHINGLGYVNRIREITPRKGDPFLCCDISAIYGPRDDIEYQRFDVKVSGSDAQHLIRRCENAEKAGRKVLIGFRLGDPWVDQFTYSKGERAGKPGASLKARLLFIRWINIDKERVYTAEGSAPEDAANEDFPASEMPEPNAAPASASAPTPAEATPAMAASF
jgi:hypothetical protein